MQKVMLFELTRAGSIINGDCAETVCDRLTCDAASATLQVDQDQRSTRQRTTGSTDLVCTVTSATSTLSNSTYTGFSDLDHMTLGWTLRFSTMTS